jgi:hypothetical protein
MIDDKLFKEEEQILLVDKEFYLECMNNKLLKDRKTEQEIKDGLILFHHVYKFIKKQDENYGTK